MLSQRRQSRDEGAQPPPLLVIGDCETDPPVIAGAAVGAMRRIPLGPVAHRLRRGAELRREQRLDHRPQHPFEHRKVDPRHASGAPAVPQRGGGDEGEHQAAHRIEPCQSDPRRYSRMAIEPGETGIALQ